MVDFIENDFYVNSKKNDFPKSSASTFAENASLISSVRRNGTVQSWKRADASAKNFPLAVFHRVFISA